MNTKIIILVMLTLSACELKVGTTPPDPALKDIAIPYVIGPKVVSCPKGAPDWQQSQQSNFGYGVIPGYLRSDETRYAKVADDSHPCEFQLNHMCNNQTFEFDPEIDGDTKHVRIGPKTGHEKCPNQGDYNCKIHYMDSGFYGGSVDGRLVTQNIRFYDCLYLSGPGPVMPEITFTR